MGGDYAPYEIVKGALLACDEFDIKAILVGDEDAIKSTLGDLDKELGFKAKGLDYEIVHASEEVSMEEKNPAKAVRAAKNSSIVLSTKLVADGEADAVIAAGNTAAATAAALFGLKRIEGFERPCIVCTIPTMKGILLLIDAGSNAEASPEQMHQSAILGNILAGSLMDLENPRIGLLNIGEEPSKGNELYKETNQLLQAASDAGEFNFIGNVEGKTIIYDNSDVVICDGFVGNIHLKAIEGAMKMTFETFKQELNGSALGKLSGLIAKSDGIFDRLKAKFDPNSYGGALLGGVNGIVIIAHGSSNAEAIKNSVKQAKLAVENKVLERVKEKLS